MGLSCHEATMNLFHLQYTEYREFERVEGGGERGREREKGER